MRVWVNLDARNLRIHEKGVMRLVAWASAMIVLAVVTFSILPLEWAAVIAISIVFLSGILFMSMCPMHRLVGRPHVCPQCGKRLLDAIDDNTCPKCYASIPDEPEPGRPIIFMPAAIAFLGIAFTITVLMSIGIIWIYTR